MDVWPYPKPLGRFGFKNFNGSSNLEGSQGTIQIHHRHIHPAARQQVQGLTLDFEGHQVAIAPGDTRHCDVQSPGNGNQEVGPGQPWDNTLSLTR